MFDAMAPHPILLNFQCAGFKLKTNTILELRDFHLVITDESADHEPYATKCIPYRGLPIAD
jgi:hypothetical protein